MVQPDACASISALGYKKTMVTSQDKRQKWRKNYMVMSTPCQNPQSHRYHKPVALQPYPEFLQSQSLNSSHRKRQRYQRKLLRILRRCADSVEKAATHSYIESMRSTNSSVVISDYFYEDLIDLSNEPALTPSHSGVHTGHAFIDAKHYSEILLRDGERLGGARHLDYEHDYYYNFRTHNSPIFLIPKLKLTDSYSSFYAEDGETSSICDRSQRDVDTVGDESNPNCLDIIRNGKTTAFLSEDENHQSFYYDDEFDTENLGELIHDSDLEAAICNEYASLLDNAAGCQLLPNSIADAYQSNISSDFENIFPASLSLNDEISERGSSVNSGEESHTLDTSMPNFADMPCATAADYQITFAHGGSLYSDARSGYLTESEFDEDEELPRQNDKKNSPPFRSNQDDHPTTEIVQQGTQGSTTWLEMKKNYTTWGQVKIVKDDPKKSKSTPDMRQTGAAIERESVRRPSNQVDDAAAAGNKFEEQKRYSLTLWEQYKRAHSMRLSASLSELTTPEVFNEPTKSVPRKTINSFTNKLANSSSQSLKESINNLIDDALGSDNKHSPSTTKRCKLDELLKLPDVSFLRDNKTALSDNKWWNDIFDQPSFCTPGISIKTCSDCERKHSSDYQVILYQGSQPKQHKICQLSMLEQVMWGAGSNCQCIKEKLCDLSSGIATGSSGVTPREPNSWQHIADFLKKRQRQPDGNSRGSLNTTLNDQQLLDVVACIEAADMLAKCCSQSACEASDEILMKIWKLASCLEFVLSLGLKSHKFVTVAMGKIRTRVSIWDVVEETSNSAGNLTDDFSQILKQIAQLSVDDVSLKFCLFVVGLLNVQCLDFWLQILTHSKDLLDKYYHAESFLRSNVIADKRLLAETLQSLQPLSVSYWDVDIQSMLKACTRSTSLEPINKSEGKPSYAVISPQAGKLPASNSRITSTSPELPNKEPTRNDITPFEEAPHTIRYSSTRQLVHV